MSGAVALGSALAGIGSGVANYLMSSHVAEVNQEYYRENLAANYAYSQQSQRNAASNEVIGLRNAGLSPVLADGAQGMSVPSAEGGTMQAPQFDIANLLLGAQLKNLDAQSDKTEAEATSIKIDNKNKEHRDTAFGVMMDDELEHLKTLYAGDEKMQELIDKYMALPKSKGTYEAYEATIQMLPKTFGARADLLEQKLRESVNQAKTMSAAPNNKQGADIWENPFLKNLVNADASQVDKTIAETARFVADTDNIREVINLTKSQKQLTDSDKSRIEAMANQIKNSDIRTLIDKGDYTGALISLLTGFLMTISLAPIK